MKKLLTALAILSASFTAQAEESKGISCKEISEFAGSIMQIRQQGTPMADVYDRAGGSKVIESLIIPAYEVPKFNTAEYKQREVNKFKNEFFLVCVKN